MICDGNLIVGYLKNHFVFEMMVSFQLFGCLHVGFFLLMEFDGQVGL